MVGATGAVGSEVVKACRNMNTIDSMTLLGRRKLALEAIHADSDADEATRIDQHIVDVLDASTYEHLLDKHAVAICTLGVGQPSTMSKEQFVMIDKTAVLDFATACKRCGVQHFQLLGSVGSDARSRSFYLRTKGELQDALRGLEFDRLSLFQPSMILTPSNRYGWLQALTLAVWPWLSYMLPGPLRKFRGIKVDQLGKAIALNAGNPLGQAQEVLYWDDFMHLIKRE